MLDLLVTLTVRNTRHAKPFGILAGQRRTWSTRAITKVDQLPDGRARLWIEGGFDKSVLVEEAYERVMALIHGDDTL